VGYFTWISPTISLQVPFPWEIFLLETYFAAPFRFGRKGKEKRKMRRYLTFDVTDDMTDHTIEKILRHQAGLTKRQISQAKFRQDGIRKNGVQCRVTDRVLAGDELSICLEKDDIGSGHIQSMKGCLDILYEDDDILAVNKPSGLVTHPVGGHYQDTLVNLAAGYFEEKNEKVTIRPIGRLDKETSGIVIFAKNQPAAGQLQRQREKKMFQKTYLALVQGDMPVDNMEHTIDLPIAADPENHLRMRTAPSDAHLAYEKPAITHYTVLESGRRYSVVQLWLETGRTHQIRIHMQSIGHPLIGDTLYNPNFCKAGNKVGSEAGATVPTMKRTALHACKVQLKLPFTGESIIIQAPVPEDMESYIK
jgi:23S rRNA pseudouridine1911/1915/1917 synthase